jgi:anoctamin-10
VYTYVTTTTSEGGLGIHPDNDVWSRVESVMALHDPEYNDRWIRSVTKTVDIGHDQLDFIRNQVRASIPNHVAYYPYACSLARLSLFTSLFSPPTPTTSSLSQSLAF